MKQKLINLLGKMGYSKEIASYAFENNKHSYRENMKYAFNDSEGNQYYYFPSQGDYPLVMSEKLDELFAQLMAKLPNEESDAVWEKIGEILTSDKLKNEKKVQEVLYWCEAVKNRRRVNLDAHILMQIAALIYIRQDENPMKYNQELHMLKYKQFMKDATEGGYLYDFFQKAGLSRYIPIEIRTAEGWQKFMVEYLKKVEALNSEIGQTSTFVSNYANSEKMLLSTS